MCEEHDLYGLHFVANPDGTFTCEMCFGDELRARLGDDDVQVWEVGSRGWTAPVVCATCKLSIPVVVDRAVRKADPLALLAELAESHRVEINGNCLTILSRGGGVYTYTGGLASCILRAWAGEPPDDDDHR